MEGNHSVYSTYVPLIKNARREVTKMCKKVADLEFQEQVWKYSLPVVFTALLLYCSGFIVPRKHISHNDPSIKIHAFSHVITFLRKSQSSKITCLTSRPLTMYERHAFSVLWILDKWQIPDLLSIKLDLPRSCFQFWLKISEEGDKISKQFFPQHFVTLRADFESQN